MILSDIINVLQVSLEGTNLFNTIYPIAEIKRTIQQGQPKTFPAATKGLGEFIPLEYDSSGGMTYFRRNGSVNLRPVHKSDVPLIIQTSCGSLDDYYLLNYSLKQICFISKEKASCVDGFEDDELAYKVIGAVSDADIKITDIVSVSVTANQYETDHLKVLQSEYSNWQDINDINYNYAYFSIDWSLQIIAKKTCLDPCEINY